MVGVQKMSKNKINCGRNIIVDVINENELLQTDNQELPIEKSPTDVTNKSAIDEDLPLNKEDLKVESDLMDVLNCNGNAMTRCEDKQNENNIFLSYRDQATSPVTTNQKPKIRSLSLKKRGLEPSNDNIPSDPKRTCYELSEIIKPEFIAPGLKNLGNSCYMNSAIQVLYYLPNFRSLIFSLTENIKKIKTHPSKESYCRWEKLEFVRRLNKLLDDMNRCFEEGKAVVDPANVFRIMELINPSFRSGDQQDVHEFFMCLLSILQDAIKEINSSQSESLTLGQPPMADSKISNELAETFFELLEEPPGESGKISSQERNSSDVTLPMSFEEDVDSNCIDGQQPSGETDETNVFGDFVADLFQGTLERVTRCMECESESKTSESFQDLLLNLKRQKQKPSNSESCDEAQSRSDLSDDDDEEDDDVTSMLKSLSEKERLDSGNKYLCLACNHLVEAERRIRFVDSPQVLIFHLQRFAQSQGPSGMFLKVIENTGIPLEMNCLEENCPSPSQHRLKLFAVITHSGYSPYSGHYMAYINASLTSTKDQSYPTTTPPPQNHQNISTTRMRNPNVFKNIDSGSTHPQDHITNDNNLDQVWLELNDHQVKKLKSGEIDRVTGSRVTSNNPYMLFYCRATYD